MTDREGGREGGRKGGAYLEGGAVEEGEVGHVHEDDKLTHALLGVQALREGGRDGGKV